MTTDAPAPTLPEPPSQPVETEEAPASAAASDGLTGEQPGDNNNPDGEGEPEVVEERESRCGAKAKTCFAKTTKP